MYENIVCDLYLSVSLWGMTMMTIIEVWGVESLDMRETCVEAAVNLPLALFVWACGHVPRHIHCCLWASE